jgi:hypothetical protein
MSKIELQKGATARKTRRNQQSRRKLANSVLEDTDPFSITVLIFFARLVLKDDEKMEVTEGCKRLLKVDGLKWISGASGRNRQPY